jgi:hypothetical protein
MPIYTRIIKPGHGPAVKAQSARTDNEVGTLQGAIAQCVHFSLAWLLTKLSHCFSLLRK